MSDFPPQSSISVTSKRSACDRCRSQKLRCPPREKTTDRCSRCSRLGVHCITTIQRRRRVPPPKPPSATSRRPSSIASRILDSRNQSSLMATDPTSLSPAYLETLASADLSFATSSQVSQSDQMLDRLYLNSNYFGAVGDLPRLDYIDISDTDSRFAETEIEEIHQLSNSKIVLEQPPPIWESDKRLAHLNLILSTRLSQSPLGGDGSTGSSLYPSQDSGCSVASESWSSHMLGDILRDTAGFISIIESYTPLRRDSLTGPANTLRLGTVVQLNLLSVHLQLVATYDRLLRHFHDQLCADASSSSSVVPCTQADPTKRIALFDLPGTEVAGFQVQQSTLQIKILLETILHNLAMVERLMGLPMTWRVTDRQRDPRSMAGVFENRQARMVLEAVGLSAIDWTDGVPDDHEKLPAVASLRDGIKRLQVMIE